MELRFYSCYGELPVVKGEDNSGESDVDLALYKPTSQRIDEYIRSGEILEDSRRLKYHTDMLENLEDGDYVDPLLYRGYDRSDLELLHKEAIEDIFIRRRPGFSSASEGADEGPNKGPEEAPQKPGGNPETPSHEGASEPVKKE
jgi:hypothetical protein